MTRELSRNLTTGRPLPLILRFMLPVLGGNLFQQFYNLVDTVIVGRYLGLNPLASVGSCTSIIFLVIGFCSGLCTGFSIPISQQFGAGKNQEMRKFAANGWYLAAGISLFLTVITVLLCRTILTFMQTPDTLFDDAYSYQVIIFWGIPFTILYNYASGIIRAVGDSRTPFLFLVLSAVLNIFLDLFCIISLKMGVAGAAVATVLSQAVSGILCLLYMYRKFPVLRLQKEEWTPDKQKCLILLNMGLPMGLQFSITAIGSIMLQSAVNLLGPVYVASYTAALKIKAVFVSVGEALGNTVAVWCGQNLGAGRKDRIREGIRDSLLIGAVFSVIAVILLWNFSDEAALLFMDRSHADVIRNVCLFMKITSCFYMILILLQVFRNAIQGMGESRIAIIGGVIEMIARTCSSLFLIPRFGYIMVCYTDQMAWISATIFLLFLYRSVMKKAAVLMDAD